LDTDDAKYPVKKTTMSDPTASSELTSGNIRIRGTAPVRQRRSSPTPLRPKALSARVTGFPSASPMGVTDDRTTACIAATQNNVERYTARAPHVP